MQMLVSIYVWHGNFLKNNLKYYFALKETLDIKQYAVILKDMCAQDVALSLNNLNYTFTNNGIKA